MRLYTHTHTHTDSFLSAKEKLIQRKRLVKKRGLNSEKRRFYSKIKLKSFKTNLKNQKFNKNNNAILESNKSFNNNALKANKLAGTNKFGKNNSLKEQVCKNKTIKEVKIGARNDAAITLIALIISIIVMLILAGVSLSAIVGDNGILTQAQNASVKSSEAVLTEFLQEKYVDSEMDSLNNSDNSQSTALAKMKVAYSGYFYDPRKDSTVSTAYDYIYYYDSESSSYYSLYFIKKSGLPEDIQKQLLGGDAVDSTGEAETYLAYRSFSDCYLVTDDLEVHYLDGSLDTNSLVEDTEGGLKVAYATGSTMAKKLSSDGTSAVTIQDALSKTELEITGDDGISDLSNLYALSNLKKLTLTNYKGSLKGLGNLNKLTYLYINNSDGSTNIDYNGIDGATGLTELYFYMPTDAEVEKMCNAMSGTDYTKLQTLGVYGFSWFNSFNFFKDDYTLETATLERISYFSKLSSATKAAVIKMNLQNCSISSLDGLQGFTKLSFLRLSRNNLNDISLIRECSNLQTLLVDYNGDISIGSSITVPNSLKRIMFYGCSSVDSLLGLLNASSLSKVSGTDITSFEVSDVAQLVARYSSCTYELNGKYGLALTNSSTVDLSNQNLTDSDLAALKGKTNITSLNLSNNTALTGKCGETLKTLTGLTTLTLSGCSGINDVSFLSSLTNLQNIYLDGTSATDVTSLNLLEKLNKVSIDNEDIDINSIVPAINKTDGDSGFMFSSELFKKLELCTELTHLTSRNSNFYSTIDFSNTSLTSVKMWGGFDNIIWPITLKNVSLCNVYSNDFSLCKNLDSVTFRERYREEYIISSLSTIPNSEKVSIEISLNGSDLTSNIIQGIPKITKSLTLSDEISYTELRDSFKDFSNLSTKNVIESITIYGTSMEAVPVIGSESTVTSADFHYNYVSDLKNFSNECYKGVKTVKLYSNNIVSLEGIENLSLLESLDLRYNSTLGDYWTQEVNGVNETIYTCEFLVNNFPNLKSVKLNGTSITDFSALTKAGFVNDGNNNFTKN